MLVCPGTLRGLSEPHESPLTYEMQSTDQAWRGLLREVAPLQDMTVRLLWSGGIEEQLDLSPALLGARIHHRFVSNGGLFATVRIGAHGTMLSWADGSILPARSVAAVAELHMTNNEFRDAMRLLDLSYAAIAAHLGLSESQVGNFRRDKPVPKHIALAVRYLLHLRIERYSTHPLA